MPVCKSCGSHAEPRKLSASNPSREVQTEVELEEVASLLSTKFDLLKLDTDAPTDELWRRVIAGWGLQADEEKFDWLVRPPADVDRDLDLLLESFKLHGIRRFFHQRFFEEETRAAEYASRVEVAPRLETVAEHSWQVADAVMLLCPQFPQLDLARTVQLAVLHDKTEIYIGDIDPIGRDGTGRKSHAFNVEAKAKKQEKERAAIDRYTSRLPPSTRSHQRSLLLEAMDCATPEAKFMKSIDKLAAISFILLKKQGRIEDKQIQLVYHLTVRNIEYFPPLKRHHWALMRRIVSSAAKIRKVSSEDLREAVLGSEMRLW